GHRQYRQRLVPLLLSPQQLGPIKCRLDGVFRGGPLPPLPPQGRAAQQQHRQGQCPGRCYPCRVAPAPLPQPPHHARRPRPDGPAGRDGGQVAARLLRRRVAVGRVLLHRLEDARLELRRDGLVAPPRRRRLLEGDLPQQLLPVGPAEGWLQGQQFVQRG